MYLCLGAYCTPSCIYLFLKALCKAYSEGSNWKKLQTGFITKISLNHVKFEEIIQILETLSYRNHIIHFTLKSAFLCFHNCSYFNIVEWQGPSQPVRGNVLMLSRLPYPKPTQLNFSNLIKKILVVFSTDRTGLTENWKLIYVMT